MVNITKTKVYNRATRKGEITRILEREKHNEKYYKEKIETQGAFVISRRRVLKNAIEINEIELLTLVAKLNRPCHTDEEIGKMFREIFKN